jgi:hypothetical protein
MYLTCANYFGEIIEWMGLRFKNLVMSGLVLFLWTFANLFPWLTPIKKKI